MNPVNALVFPAYAGMIQLLEAACHDIAGVPRIRGDDPLLPSEGCALMWCSPHTRG